MTLLRSRSLAAAQGGLEGMKLVEVGVDDTSVRRAFRERLPVTVEIERGSDTTVMARCVPLRVTPPRPQQLTDHQCADRRHDQHQDQQRDALDLPFG